METKEKEKGMGIGGGRLLDLRDSNNNIAPFRHRYMEFAYMPWNFVHTEKSRETRRPSSPNLTPFSHPHSRQMPTD
uniref:Uncharacterized protein n=1 Tax=Vespula pensylvanica TaxID=30213 RepID=A0A834P168_VESPE|nr:hypothetical protein H0235_008790 [Vespula pensylvanica]